MLALFQICAILFSLWGYMINTSLRITALRLSLVAVLSAGLRLATLALRLRLLSLVTPSRASSAKSPRATCPIPPTIGRSCGRIPKKTDFFRWLFFWFCYSFFCYGNYEIIIHGALLRGGVWVERVVWWASRGGHRRAGRSDGRGRGRAVLVQVFRVVPDVLRRGINRAKSPRQGGVFCF